MTQGWPAFHRLLLSLFKFLAPFVRNAPFQNASRNLFRGAQRVLLVLLHDFPDFLSEYYFTICDVIPPQCVQLRNLVQCAYPSPAQPLPDPHLVDIHAEFGPIPTILSDFTSPVVEDVRAGIDRYVVGRGTQTFPVELRDQLALPTPSPGGDRYNTSIVNAVTLYIGATAVTQAKARTGSPLFLPSDPSAQLFLRLASELDLEGT